MNEIVRWESCDPTSPVAQCQGLSQSPLHAFYGDVLQALSLSPSDTEKETSSTSPSEHCAQVEQGPTWWIIKGAECGWHDMTLLRERAPHRFPTVRPEKLTIDPHSGKLTHEDGRIIEQCLLELHQEELFALPPPVFHALLDLSHAGRCWNDLRVILLVHDKRLLALLSGAHPTLLEGLLATLPCPQARARCRRILRECIVPTVSSVDVEKPQPLPETWLHLRSPPPFARFQETEAMSVDEDVESEETPHLMYKPHCSGKGQGIVDSRGHESLQAFVQSVQEARLPPSAQEALRPLQEHLGQALWPAYEAYFASGVYQPFQPHSRMLVTLPPSGHPTTAHPPSPPGHTALPEERGEEETEKRGPQRQ